MAPAPDRIFTYTQIHRVPDCARRCLEGNVQSRGARNSNEIVGRGETRNVTPVGSIPAVAFA